MLARDEVILIRDICAVVAGVHERRRTDPDVNLCGSRISQHVNLVCDRVSSYDRIIDNNNSLAAYDRRTGIKLDLNSLLALFLGRLDECSSYISVLNESLLIRDA